MHGLHSSKKFLEFGLLCYHKPLRRTPDLKEAFTKFINLVLFFFWLWSHFSSGKPVPQILPFIYPLTNMDYIFGTSLTVF